MCGCETYVCSLFLIRYRDRQVRAELEEFLTENVVLTTQSGSCDVLTTKSDPHVAAKAPNSSIPCGNIVFGSSRSNIRKVVGMALSKLSRSVDGVRVLITGAASGMGRATAHLFADQGARVVVADRDQVGVSVVVAEISAEYGNDKVRGVAGDVSTPQGRQDLVQTVVDAWGGVDVLINNAGISLVTSVFSDEDTFLQNWDQTLAVNVSAHAHLIRLCLPHLMKAPSGGRVVNIASTEAIVATGGLSAYTASKHAVIGLTKNCAVELGRHNITVNAICPGPIETGMTAGITQEAKEKYSRRKVPLRRYGIPEEVAQMTLSLCLPAASFTNGAALVVDGGMTIKHG